MPAFATACRELRRPCGPHTTSRQLEQVQACQQRRCVAAVRCTTSSTGEAAMPADSSCWEGGRHWLREAWCSWWHVLQHGAHAVLAQQRSFCQVFTSSR